MRNLRDGVPRIMGRAKRTWMDVVSIDIKKCNLPKHLDRLKWRNKIHVADPNIVWTRL